MVEVLSNSVRELEGIEDADAQRIGELMERDLNRDAVDRYAPGIYQLPLHVNENRRRSGSRNFLADTVAAKNSNGSAKYPLSISTHSLATRVLFDTKTGGKPKAYGVEYLKGEALYGADTRYDGSQSGKLHKVTAAKEVIVSGGSFNTPQILKLSGVGPREELEQHGIDVIVDLPAVVCIPPIPKYSGHILICKQGNYLQDSYEAGVTIEANIPWENNPFAACEFTLEANDTCLQQWETMGTGPYGEGAAPIGLLYRSSVSETDYSDLFFFGAAGVVFRGYFPGFSTYNAPPTSWFWSVVKMQTGNTAGTVKLRSANPKDAPSINLNFFEEQGERDLQALQEGIEHTLRAFNATGEPYAPYKQVEPRPDIDMKQAIKDETFSHHVTSSCRMGPAGDKDYCVDSNFKVNGVEGLRVVDASIFPRNPGGFPVAPTFVISQKAFKAITQKL